MTIKGLFDLGTNDSVFNDLTEKYYTSESLCQFLIASDIVGYTKIPLFNEFSWHMFLLRHKIDIFRFMMMSSLVSMVVISVTFTTIIVLLTESIGMFSIMTTPLLLFMEIFMGYRTLTFMDSVTEVDIMSRRYNNRKQNDWHFHGKTK